MKQIVLVGAGHTHAYVLSRWRRSPISGAQLTCVSPYRFATYSGMLPGMLAGQFERVAMEIDLAVLCASAGVRLIVAEASGLDVGGQRVLLDGAVPEQYDVVSVGVGSVPSLDGVRIDAPSAFVPVKPIQTFIARLTAAVTIHGPAGTRPLRLAVVGGGAAGVELALCVPRFIARARARLDTRCVLVTSARLLDDSSPSTIAHAASALERRGIVVHEHCRVTTVAAGALTLDNGTWLPTDVAIWATAATAPPFLRATGLPVDERGFLLTNSTLRAEAGGPVFAVGDSGSIDGLGVPKAGVYAVRQGPILWANLRRTLEGRTLLPYTPQKSFLKLLNTGDGRAIGEWRSWSFEGRLPAAIKAWIDRRFVEQFQAGR